MDKLSKCQGLKIWNNRKVWVPKDIVLKFCTKKARVGYMISQFNEAVPGYLQGNGKFDGKVEVRFRFKDSYFSLMIPTSFIKVKHDCFNHSIPLDIIPAINEIAYKLHTLPGEKVE